MLSFLSLSSLKKLLPIGVVGTSVAITIKLLTVATTPTTELLNVNPEEDIKKVEDYVEEPEEEEQEEMPPPPVEKIEEEEGSAEEQLEDEDAEEMEADSGGGSKEEEAPPKEPESKEQEDQPKANLTFRDGELKGIFSAIFNEEP